MSWPKSKEDWTLDDKRKWAKLARHFKNILKTPQIKPSPSDRLAFARFLNNLAPQFRQPEGFSALVCFFARRKERGTVPKRMLPRQPDAGNSTCPVGPSSSPCVARQPQAPDPPRAGRLSSASGLLTGLARMLAQERAKEERKRPRILEPTPDEGRGGLSAAVVDAVEDPRMVKHPLAPHSTKSTHDDGELSSDSEVGGTPDAWDESSDGPSKHI
mmetsp:Transcript_8322/g.9454  ORF Transcript_8322/g.9454 Transcript_8322/m.9454 type:complete len:215 (+) Transcript_8322:41-685(+)